MPIVQKEPRSPIEMAVFAGEMAALNPNGFRQPGKKKGTSLPEQIYIKNGANPRQFAPDKSQRSKYKKLKKAWTRSMVKLHKQQGLQWSKNLKNGRDKKRYMEYCGHNKELVGEKAIVLFNKYDDVVQVQFDNEKIHHKRDAWLSFKVVDFKDVD